MMSAVSFKRQKASNRKLVIERADKAEKIVSDRKSQIEEMANDRKLIFTKVNNRRCALLLQDRRLLAASFQGEKEKVTGGIYVARVRDIVNNLNACFVEIKQGMICFLPDLKDQLPFYIPGQKRDFSKDPVPKQGDLILVQGIREAQKTKQPAVTAKVSLSNRFFAIALGSNKTGFSTKLSSATKVLYRKEICSEDFFDDKGNLKNWTWADPKIYPNVSLFPPAGIIFRTQCCEVDIPVLKQALAGLIHEFTGMLQEACYRSQYSCLRTPPSPWQDALNHFVLPQEYDELLTDDPELYEEMQESELIPVGKELRFYEDANYPLEKLYGLSTKIEDALCKRVWLKSGAYLIIEPTEALTVIDVNSGKFEASRAKDDYYTAINLEAAREIAYQIRLRNLSGMILIDFINMTAPEDQEALIRLMQELLQQDRVKTCVIDFTKLGLMEITRQKTVPPLLEQAIKYQYPLPRSNS